MAERYTNEGGSKGIDKFDKVDKVVDLFIRSPQQKIKEISLDRIVPRKDQPRKEFDDIETMAASIQEHGVIQPIRVRPAERPGYYEIIAGERRWRGSAMAGKETIPCIVVDEHNHMKVMLEALIENLQRKNLKAIEMALAIKDIIEYSKTSEGKPLTLEEVGKQLGYGKARIHQLLSILKLPDHMKQAFCESGLNEMHARALTQLKRYPETQKTLFNEIMDKKLTGQQAVEWATRHLAQMPKKEPTSKLVEKTIKDFTRLKTRFSNMDSQEKNATRTELENVLKVIKEALVLLNE
ncbi:ParB/RepB/Spo0J family partition protein [Desulforamulus aquiferis]|uniref:ParB/RepB/Spo0J family partition protein n=2 Tax=Desulforamulus aquiferis TaxID=1397668 RepID=A0AAW7ZA70_9FIRM|nr:ParB/RepB/Spo0J family partition protein [Desulforamulus aquiferis]